MYATSYVCTSVNFGWNTNTSVIYQKPNSAIFFCNVVRPGGENKTFVLWGIFWTPPQFAVGGIAKLDVYQIGKRGGDKSDNISYQFATIVWRSLNLDAILIQTIFWSVLTFIDIVFIEIIFHPNLPSKKRWFIHLSETKR